MVKIKKILATKNFEAGYEQGYENLNIKCILGHVSPSKDIQAFIQSSWCVTLNILSE